MRANDMTLANEISEKLTTFNEQIRPLPGIFPPERVECLLEQIIDSTRRIKYVAVIRDKNISPSCADPNHDSFDPIKAASWYRQQGNINESFWLIFLSIHFGKHGVTKWRLVRDLYGGLGNVHWNWPNINNDLDGFKVWLNENEDLLKSRGKFGNHRKYQSLNAYRSTGTGAAVSSYIEWAGVDHQMLIDSANNFTGNARELFSFFYRSMNEVAQFGRTAKFDYLTMIGKLGLVNLEPDSTYMQGATGPLKGARLLFGGSVNAAIQRTTLNSVA